METIQVVSIEDWDFKKTQICGSLGDINLFFSWVLYESMLKIHILWYNHTTKKSHGQFQRFQLLLKRKWNRSHCTTNPAGVVLKSALKNVQLLSKGKRGGQRRGEFEVV